MHLLYPDPRQLALARLALGRVMGFPHWDWLRDSQQRPVSIMRGAGACMGLALVSEWLAADLTRRRTGGHRARHGRGGRAVVLPRAA